MQLWEDVLVYTYAQVGYRMGSSWVVSGKIGGISTLNTSKYDTDTNSGIWYIKPSKHKEMRQKSDTKPIQAN